MGFGEDFSDDWEHANAERPISNPESPCDYCGSKTFEHAEGNWYCLDCGTKYNSKKHDDKEWDSGDFDINPEDDIIDDDSVEDNEWKNSEFFVRQPKKSGRTGKSTGTIPPLISTLMKARRLLNMNRRTKSTDRSPLFFPFYASSEGKGMLAADIINSAFILPGPFIDLLYNDHLPPRRWWHKANLGEDGLPIGPSDWIPHYHRLGFELFIHLHTVHNRPWTLEGWAKKIRIGTRLLEILEKGGPLGRVGGDYLRKLNHRGGLMKTDIEGFMDNLLLLNVVTSFNDADMIADEAWSLLQRMRETPSKGSTIFDRFTGKNCMLSSNDEPTQFWCIYNKSRTEVGTFCVQSIPIAFAVAEVAKRLENIPPESIVNIGNSDISVTNTQNIDRLSAWWRWCIREIGENSVISRPRHT